MTEIIEKADGSLYLTTNILTQEAEVNKGGAGSGNFGHSGRTGVRGGSGGGGGGGGGGAKADAPKDWAGQVQRVKDVMRSKKITAREGNIIVREGFQTPATRVKDRKIMLETDRPIDGKTIPKLEAALADAGVPGTILVITSNIYTSGVLLEFSPTKALP